MDWVKEYEEETGFSAYEFGGVPKRGYVEWLEEELDLKAKAGQHETIVMWRIVEDNPPPLDEIVWLFDGFKTWIGGRAMVDSEYWLYGNTYGSIWHNGKKWNGDLETDDDYKPILWKPLPEPPQAA